MSRMFLIDGKPMRTWNVFVGCRFDCNYCCARSMALGRLKDSPRYRQGFKPHLVEEELGRSFTPGELIFVSFMGDISFASWVELILILDRIKRFPRTDFLFLTKNPSKFFDWDGEEISLPANTYLGTTIETNRNLSRSITLAPRPWERFNSLASFPHARKFVSIEPLIDFNLPELISWLETIKPEIVEVGADNYGHQLPEPPWGKVEELLGRLREFVPKVVEKEGLARLKQNKVMRR